MTKRRIALAVCVLVIVQQSALAWNDTGHMVIAQIAYSRLNDRARARADSLAGNIRFREKTYDFVTLACWMDDFRKDPRNDPYAPWHYIDVPIFVPPFRTRVIPAAVNAAERIAWCENRLKHSSGLAADDARMMGYLEHLVGDIHQPLHCATRYSAAHPEGDKGGNEFKIVTDLDWLNNLHRLWDAAGGAFGFERLERPLTPEARQLIEQYAREVVAEYPAERLTAWRRMSPRTWVNEGNQLARRYVYALRGDRPDARYTARTQAISRERIALAGYRLAELLNGLLGSE